MASFRLLFVGALIILFAGCNTFRWGWLKKEPESIKPGGPPPSVAAIIDYMNNNAARVQSLRVDDLRGSAGQGVQSLFSFSGVMMADKPKNFRMGLKAFGNPVGDLGSNNQEFWFWTKGTPLLYCSYKDFTEGRAQSMPIPIQPEWVMEVLGLGPYGPAEKYQLEQDAKSIRLVERFKSPQGKSLKKVMVFRWPPVQPPKAQVSDFLLIDEASGKELCSAHITETQVDQRPEIQGGTGVILPQYIEIRCLDPEQKTMKMSLRLNGMIVNPSLQPTAFVRQPLRGIEALDLTRVQFDSRVQRTQGTNP